MPCMLDKAHHRCFIATIISPREYVRREDFGSDSVPIKSWAATCRRKTAGVLTAVLHDERFTRWDSHFPMNNYPNSNEELCFAVADRWLQSDNASNLMHEECGIETEVDDKSWSFLKARCQLLLQLYPTTKEVRSAHIPAYYITSSNNGCAIYQIVLSADWLT